MIPFHYGSGTVTGTVINYGSGSAKAKSYGSYGYGSGSATLLEDMVLKIIALWYTSDNTPPVCHVISL